MMELTLCTLNYVLCISSCKLVSIGWKYIRLYSLAIVHHVLGFIYLFIYLLASVRVQKKYCDTALIKKKMYSRHSDSH